MDNDNDDQNKSTNSSLLSGFKNVITKNKKVFVTLFIVLLVILFIYICREKLVSKGEPLSSLKEKIAEFNKIQNQNIKNLSKQ